MTTRRYVDVGGRQVHVALDGPPPGEGRPAVVLLHQTPRSVDEFAEVMPLLAAAGHPVVAVDLPGMGASDPPARAAAIESMAAGVAGAVDALGLGRCAVVGHHTGGVVAVEVAASRPDLVARLVLSSTAYVDAAARERRRTRPAIDAVDVDGDGAFLAELWNRRRAFYPPDRPDLLVRYVRDALRVADPEAGHRAVGAYEMERRLPHVAAPTLLIGHDADPYAFGELGPLGDAFAAVGVAVESTIIAGGMVPLEFTADAFASAVLAFLAR